MSSITEVAVSSVGNSRLAKATRPSAPTKAVSANPIGITAATTAPNTASRMPSVSGMASSSAWWKSLPTVASRALSALASPNCSTDTPGCAARTAATASSVGSAGAGSSSVPFRLKASSTERRS